MLPCSEQLRPKDIELRLRRARPALIVTHERNTDAVAAAAPDCPVLTVPHPDLLTGHERATVRRPRRSRPLLRPVHLRDERPAEARHARAALRVGPGGAVAPLARRRAGRAGLVDRRAGLVEVRAQRLPRAVVVRRSRAVAGQTLRPGRASRDDPRRAGADPLHGTDRVPPDRGTRPDRECAVVTADRHCRRGTRHPGARGLARADRTADRRRLRPDRDRSCQWRAARRDRSARLDGPAAARRPRRDRGRRAVRRSRDRPDVLPRLRRRGRRPRACGTPATGSARTRTAGCSSRRAPTT